MKFNYSLIFLIITLGCTKMSSNKTGFKFKANHLAIMVNDLEKTGDFYSEVLQIEEIDITATGLTHRWFKLENGLEIHLVSSPEMLPKKTRNNHLAIQTNDINTMTTYLEEKKIEYSDWFGNENKIQKRFDGVLQVYITDPEGNWVEINQKPN